LAPGPPLSEPAPGDLEDMEVVVVPLARISAYVRRGEVAQFSSAAALAIADLMLRSRASEAR